VATTQETSADLVVVGAGPAGLSTAVFGASEGLDTIVLEHRHVGGQSASSSQIENYYGFPDGISGSELAERGRAQAERFGVRIAQAQARALRSEGERRVVETADGRRFVAPAVVLACGLAPRPLGVPGEPCEDVFYGAHASVYDRFSGTPVVVVGAANSAGQAAMKLSETCEVSLVVRGGGLSDAMSAYLSEQVLRNARIAIRRHAAITRFVTKSGRLLRVETTTGVIPAGACFVFIGSAPDTSWCSSACMTDERGYLRINAQYETSLPGVFAVGDVHENSRGRIAAAVGEGSIAVAFVQEYLAELRSVHVRRDAAMAEARLP